MLTDNLNKWIETYKNDCNMAINIASLVGDRLTVADYEGRIKSLDHLLESIKDGELE